jgi:hypothetical protein
MKAFKNYIKALLCVVVLGMTVSSALAQDGYLMRVWKNNVVINSYPTQDVDSVTFIANVVLTDFTVDASLSLMKYDEVQITPTPIPADVANSDFTFDSDNTAVLTVDLDGNVSALARGTAKITVSNGEISKEINVTVEDFSDMAEWTVTTDNLWGEEGDPNMWWAAPANILNTWDEIFWCSDPAKTLPATVTVDMKHAKRIASFDYGCPKAGGGNDAIPLAMIVEVSPDGAAWTKVVDLEECPSGRGVLHQFPMETPVWARYYRATVSAVLGGYPYLQLAYLAPSDIEAPEAD